MPVIANLETPQSMLKKRPAAHPLGLFFASQKMTGHLTKPYFHH